MQNTDIRSCRYLVLPKQIVQLCNIYPCFLSIQWSTDPLASGFWLVSYLLDLPNWWFNYVFDYSFFPFKSLSLHHSFLFGPHFYCWKHAIHNWYVVYFWGYLQYSDHIFLSLPTLGLRNNLCTHTKPTINKVRIIRYSAPEGYSSTVVRTNRVQNCSIFATVILILGWVWVSR